MNLAPEDYIFLNSIKDYVKNKPEIAPLITEYSQQGIKEKLEEARELQLKTEVALVTALNRKYKTTDETILNALKTIEGKTCFDYKDTINKLEENN